MDLSENTTMHNVSGLGRVSPSRLYSTETWDQDALSELVLYSLQDEELRGETSEPGGTEVGVRVALGGLRGLRSWGPVRGQRLQWDQGSGCVVTRHKDTKGRGDKRLLKQRVAGTSSQSIEPSERDRHTAVWRRTCMRVLALSS